MNGWRCPKCGSVHVRVRAHAWAPLIQTLDRDDGVDENEFALGQLDDHEWNGSSMMDCTACGHEATAHTFYFQTAPSGTIPVINERPEPDDHPADWHIHT